ncbi:rho gtpase-activating protein 68f [Anaeramoeba flamelloides]|uniref:Rho gtpase-activating protein 68f n=1 Tax=Anaeramoeba flamelloides TaxID=1746091 RepID=A0ABQ8Y3T3_9EUKA|nr:rho gtpase-activating protein 68f [Anaeramoeba flamelloides]
MNQKKSFYKKKIPNTTISSSRTVPEFKPFVDKTKTIQHNQKKSSKSTEQLYVQQAGVFAQDFDISEVTDPYLHADLIKHFFQSLPSPLLRTDIIPQWKQADDLYDIVFLVHQLPKENYYLLKELICFLKIVSCYHQNLMDATNLHNVFFPSIFGSSFSEEFRIPKLVQFFINNYDAIFLQSTTNLNKYLLCKGKIREIFVKTFSQPLSNLFNIKQQFKINLESTKPEQKLNIQSASNRIRFLSILFAFFDIKHEKLLRLRKRVITHLLANDLEFETFTFNEYVIIYRIIIVEIQYQNYIRTKGKKKDLFENGKNNNEKLRLQIFQKEHVHGLLKLHPSYQQEIQQQSIKEEKKKLLNKKLKIKNNNGYNNDENNVKMIQKILFQVQKYLKLKTLLLPISFSQIDFSMGIKIYIQQYLQLFKKLRIIQQRNLTFEKMNLYELFYERNLLKTQLIILKNETKKINTDRQQSFLFNNQIKPIKKILIQINNLILIRRNEILIKKPNQSEIINLLSHLLDNDHYFMNFPFRINKNILLKKYLKFVEKLFLKPIH